MWFCKDPIPFRCCNILQGLWHSQPEHWRLHGLQAEQDYPAEEDYTDENDAWSNSSWAPSVVFCLAPLLILGGILMSTFLKNVISELPALQHAPSCRVRPASAETQPQAAG